MAKAKKTSKKKETKQKKEQITNDTDLEKTLPKEAQEKLKAIKKDLEKFQKKVIEKFDKYIMGMALLPPERPKEGEKPKDNINIFVLVDDSDSKKMSKQELGEKLGKIIGEQATEVNKKIKTEVMIASELWQNCYDQRHDLLEMLAVAAPLYDNGVLASIKVAEVHKQMALKKFEKYIVSYVLAGSITKGLATDKSDIDTYIIIDDTDVKRMTRAELRDKLRAIIIGMGIEAGTITGIKNKLHVQIYLLTDFWDSIRECHPVIMDFLRDGIPFYDRGVFMPWKQLLEMGRVKPSRESITMFMDIGDQSFQRVDAKMKEIAMEDLALSILYPSQAALMMVGHPPPAPKAAAKEMRTVFVKKMNLLEEEYITILDHAIKTRKAIEHGDKEKVTGKELDKLMTDNKRYLERIKKLFKKLEENKQKESVVWMYESVITAIRDILRLEDKEPSSDTDEIKMFKSEIINKGLMHERTLRMITDVIKAKDDYNNNKLSAAELEKVQTSQNQLMKDLIEYMQRKRGRSIERTKVRVKHGEKFGEIILLGNVAFIIPDLDKEDKEIFKAKIKKDGSLSPEENSSFEEFEKYLAETEIPDRAFIKEPLFENLRKIFGKDVEILVNY